MKAKSFKSLDDLREFLKKDRLKKVEKVSHETSKIEAKDFACQRGKEPPPFVPPYIKDRQRIKDILEKAGPSIEKQVQLATAQANRIKSRTKALRRGWAAMMTVVEATEIAEVFFDRYRLLSRPVETHSATS